MRLGAWLTLATALAGCGARTDLAPSGDPPRADAGADGGFSCGGGGGVEVLATRPGTGTVFRALATNQESAFWSLPGAGIDDTDSILSVPLCGGAVVTLASDQGTVNGIAVDEANVYWITASEANTGGVLRVPVGGGAVETLAASGTGSVTIDEDRVYWTDRWAAAVMSQPKAGGTTTTLAADQQGPDALAVNATFVCWTVDGTVASGSGDIPASLSCVSKDGVGGVRSVSVGAESYYLLAADEANLYTSATDDDGSVSMIAAPLGGGPPVTLGVLPPPPDPGESAAVPGGIALDSTFVYWTSAPETDGMGTVIQAPKTGGTNVTLASAQAIPTGIALAGPYVLWTNDPATPDAGPTVLLAPK